VKAGMRVLMLLAVGILVAGDATALSAAPKLRLAQTSTTTNCMMTCNSQVASCRTGCIIPGAPPTASATLTGNATNSTSCIIGCSTQLVACQTLCARNSPSP
jgi:hypothetical protein